MSELDERIALLTGRQHRVAACWQLAPLGVDRYALYRRTKDGRLRRVHRGVYATGIAPLSGEGIRMAAVLACGPGALLAARDAAAHRRLRTCNRQAVEVLVACKGRPGRRGIQVHRGAIHAEDRDVVDGIPTTSLARTLLDLAGVVEERQVQRAYEEAARQRVLDIAAIERVIDRNVGHPGVGVLKRLIAYDPEPAAQALSEPERALLDLVREAGLPTPQVNVLVEGFLVDAYWPEPGLVVEVQSHAFHSDPHTFERDHKKAAAIRAAGLDFLPITDNQIANDAAPIAALLAKLLG